ncbi:uncharacterized protein ACIB01_019611 [Guaruba guarouba]
MLQLCSPSAKDRLETWQLDMEACVEMLQQLGTWPEAAANCSDCVDLYQEVPTSSKNVEGSDAAPTVLQRNPGSLLGAQDMPMRSWDCCRDTKLGQELVTSTGNPDLDTSSSHLLLEQDLGGASSPFSALAVGSRSPPGPGKP